MREWRLALAKPWRPCATAAARLLDAVASLSAAVSPPVLRVALALPFFRSGATKWDGFALSPAARYLFQEEFQLHLFGQACPLPAPELLAWVDGIAEIVLPTLLVTGLATRASALGLLSMTIVIQLVVPDGWLTYHLPWAAMATALIAMGPGRLSVDHLIQARRGLVERAAVSARCR